MRLGTRSLLWGAHAFFLHPLQVGWGWWQLWGFPWDVRLWIGFVFHDVGYLQRDQMDGDSSADHVILGAEIVRSICGPVYADECYRHSREWCRRQGQPVSRLCLADKMAFVLAPWWIYLPMTRLTGELGEYMSRSREDYRRSGYTDEERALIFDGGQREWLKGLQSYTLRWVEAHRGEVVPGRADESVIPSGPAIAAHPRSSSGHAASDAFDTHRVADVSTEYLEPSDLPLLEHVECPTRFAITDDGAGTFHWVAADQEMFDEEMSRTAAFGLSDRFRFIMQRLRETGIPYVRFDADGGAIRHSVLPNFPGELDTCSAHERIH